MPQSCCPLCCGHCWPWKHPEETLGSWSQLQADSHTGNAPQLWWSSASHWKTQVKEITYFSTVSFSVFKPVVDLDNNFNSEAIFFLTKRLLGMLKHSVPILCRKNALYDKYAYAALSPCPFFRIMGHCPLNLKEVFLSWPHSQNSHGRSTFYTDLQTEGQHAVFGGQYVEFGGIAAKR